MTKQQNPAQGSKAQNQVNYFDGVSIRPLDRLAHLVHKHSDSFSDNDLSSFSTALECEIFDTKELVSMLGNVFEEVPNLERDDLTFTDLYMAVQRLSSALAVAKDSLSKLSDLGLACAYAGNEISSRLSVLKGEGHE